MEAKQERKWELRSVSFFIAVIVALMGFSAALATKEAAEEHGATPAAEPELSAHRDPSLAGLSVSADAESIEIVDLQF